ncbi:carbohydrate ABC transporter permease [Clostridium oryzae]|uniref:L-arabinose transport system permease protein AraQ n=1 Tax=Clostridium oryzae TaxID=1450648 RepID=A0A1V4IVU6_9CLOT|nr:carbohydrate ABC transporter permease [Clostridium oryzae]OPJ63537.1 L-arabinose transport system permease protein AraQ [Clostridium oryzae]
MFKTFRRENAVEKIFDIFIYLTAIFVLIITLYPFLNILAVSLNDSVDAARGGIGILPRKFSLANYQEIFKYKSIPHAFIISILRTIIGTVTGIVASCMVAYTLSRKDFMARKIFGVLFVLTMYISGGLIPDYMLVRKLHMVNNFAVYILPGLINTWNVIVIRSFMDNLPYSLQESAKIDGASDFVVFMKIVMPLCLPVIATISLFIAVGQWNSWMDTFLYASSKDSLSTLQYELVKVMSNTTASAGQAEALKNQTSASANTVSPESIRMAITIVATVPILVVYPFLQKYFVSGMTLGAVKQ